MDNLTIPQTGGAADDRPEEVLAEGAANPSDDAPESAADPGDGIGERLPRVAPGLDATPRAASNGGRFFAVDARTIPVICSLGLNPAVAYLVLASGTGRDQATTFWGVHSVEKYTSVSRLRARQAIDILIAKKLIVPDTFNGRPCYRLTPAEGREAKAAKAKWIWLPNTLITGADGETPPVELVRQTQDVMALRLLVELYAEGHPRADGGISRTAIWQTYERCQIGQQGAYVIWGFRNPKQWVSWESAATEPHMKRGVPREQRGADFFPRLQRLQDAGLLQFVPHLVEGDSPEAEIVHPYGLGETESPDDRLGRAANRTAVTMILPSQYEWALSQGYDLLAPVYRWPTCRCSGSPGSATGPKPAPRPRGGSSYRTLLATT
jgi:hypothetical protein